MNYHTDEAEDFINSLSIGAKVKISLSGTVLDAIVVFHHVFYAQIQAKTCGLTFRQRAHVLGMFDDKGELKPEHDQKKKK